MKQEVLCSVYTRSMFAKEKGIEKKKKTVGFGFALFLTSAWLSFASGVVTPTMLFNYCPFDISWKDVFCLAFYFKWKYFVRIDHFLSETICLLCFCVLFSNIYSKIKVTTKNWSDLCNFYSKVIFWDFCLRKYFLFFFAELDYWCFTTILWKFQKNWTSGTCWKSGSKLPTL